MGNNQKSARYWSLHEDQSAIREKEWDIKYQLRLMPTLVEYQSEHLITKFNDTEHPLLEKKKNCICEQIQFYHKIIKQSK